MRIINKVVAKAFLLVLIVFFFSSCSSLSFIYWGGEIYLNHSINTTLDLNSEQKKIVSSEIKEFLNWHKVNRLPEYEKIFSTLNAPLKTHPLSKQTIEREIEYVFESINKEQVILADKVIPKMVRVIKTFDQKQLNEVEKLFNRPSENREKYYAYTKKEYDAERLKRVVRLAGFFDVKFSQEQERDLAQHVDRLLDNRRFFRPFYREKREDLLAAIKSQDAGRLDQAFRNIMVYDVDAFPEEYEKFYYQQQEKAKSVAFEMFNILTAKQLKKLHARINKLSKEIGSYVKKVNSRLRKNQV